MTSKKPVVRGVDIASAYRVSFLEQCAVELAGLAQSENDAYSKLSASCSKEMKEFGFAEQVKPDVTMKRSVCSKCQAVLIPSASGLQPFKVAKQRKRIVITCGRCGNKKSYVHNTSYKSRNDK